MLFDLSTSFVVSSHFGWEAASAPSSGGEGELARPGHLVADVATGAFFHSHSPSSGCFWKDSAELEPAAGNNLITQIKSFQKITMD